MYYSVRFFFWFVGSRLTSIYGCESCDASFLDDCLYHRESEKKPLFFSMELIWGKCVFYLEYLNNDCWCCCVFFVRLKRSKSRAACTMVVWLLPTFLMYPTSNHNKEFEALFLFRLMAAIFRVFKESNRVRYTRRINVSIIYRFDFNRTEKMPVAVRTCVTMIRSKKHRPITFISGYFIIGIITIVTNVGLTPARNLNLK